MATRRSFTYAEVTATAEQKIRECLERAAKEAAAGDRQNQTSYRDYAFGIYIGWMALTGSEPNLADMERLEALVLPKRAT